MLRILFIVNPAAGGGRGRKIGGRLGAVLARRREVDAELRTSREPGHAEFLARDGTKQGYDRIVAVGGDGTLHEVVNGILAVGYGARSPDELPEVALIPCGTGNDFARGMGIARNTRAALQTCLCGASAPIDLGLLNGRAFVNVAGFGFDAAVARVVAERYGERGGALTYLVTALRLLKTYRPSTVVVTTGAARIERPILLGAVGNASTYGGGMRICPKAQADDGLLDLCLVGDVSPVETLVNLARVYRGRHLGYQKCSYERGLSFEVSSEHDVPVHADGQAMGHLPARFSIAPRVLRLVRNVRTSPSRLSGTVGP